MKKTAQVRNALRGEGTVNALQGGLPVRTNLRAGLAWDDLDDKAKELFGKLTSAISSAASALTSGSNTNTPAS